MTTTSGLSCDRVMVAIKQWRDSIVNMSRRNRLLNYKPTKSSTLELIRHSPDEVLQFLMSDHGTYVMGTVPPDSTAESDSMGLSSESANGNGQDFEVQDVLLQSLQEFDFAKHPDQLFVKKTQLEVDRALRNLHAKAQRQYLDRGLRVLYLALGELRWQDLAGDVYRSPLILVPVNEIRKGPRERIYFESSDEDIVFNPALRLKMEQEFGLDIPPDDELIDVNELQSGEAFAAIRDRVGEVEWPAGWEIDDFAALADFAFQNEAMYRDLLQNEAQVADSDLVRALSGGIDPEDSNFAFDPYDPQDIDRIAPPETSDLVLDADSSQRAAIQAAVDGKSFVLDGPPGTGKSQTIANAIAALIGKGKTVLFVSEKAVALDVVKKRLDGRGLGQFVFSLHSATASRKEVASALGSALVADTEVPRGLSEIDLHTVTSARIQLTDYIQAMNETRQPINDSLYQILGKYEVSRIDHPAPPVHREIASLTQLDLARVSEVATRLANRWDLHLQGERALWHGLVFGGSKDFVLAKIEGLLGEIRPLFRGCEVSLAAFDFAGVSGMRQLASMLEDVAQLETASATHWLSVVETGTSFEALQSAIEAWQLCDSAKAQLETLSAGVRRAIPFEVTAEIQPLEDSIVAIPWLHTDLPLSTALSVSDAGRRLVEVINEFEANARLLASNLGAAMPASLLESEVMLRGATALLADHAPLAAWLYQPNGVEAATIAADRLANAQRELDTAAVKAEPFFSTEVLTADFDRIDWLVANYSGFLKRGATGHKELRARLSQISSLPWKVAVSNLPAGRAWAESHSRYMREHDRSAQILGRYVGPPTQTIWTELWEALGNARVAVALPLLDFNATERVTTSILEKNSVRQIRDVVGSCLSAVRTQISESPLLPVNGHDALTTMLSQITWLTEELTPCLRVAETLNLDEGAQIKIGGVLKLLNSRLNVHSTEAKLSEALLGLHSAFPESEIDSSLDLQWLTQCQHQLEVARRVREAARDDGAALTQEQIDALHLAPPLQGAEALLDQYAREREVLTGWFDPSRQPDLAADLEDPFDALNLVRDLRGGLDLADDYLAAAAVRQQATDLGLEDVFEYAKLVGLGQSSVADFFLTSVLKAWLDHEYANDERIRIDSAESQAAVVDQFRTLDARLRDQAVARVATALHSKRPKSMIGQASLIRREAEKKRKHLPIRELVERSLDVIQAIHPCFMMSPLAVSQFMPSLKMFDVVVFDEASQILPGDAINAIYRGRSLMAAGDQHQLPPTSFFAASHVGDEEDGDEDMANDFDSLLDLMKGNGNFSTQTLRWHYRSRHEDLIAYSNHSFYESKLMTFPSAISESNDLGVHLVKVNGVYRRAGARDNPIEAVEVASRVIRHFQTRPGKSLGVVTFSTAQRDAVEAAIELARRDHPELDDSFGSDRSSGFFVKNLESVQGDERDVIIFSIGYGPDEHGRVYNQFGPVSRDGGHRRLNVAITRAKELVEIVTSINAGDIKDSASSGTRHLRRYLDFAERGVDALAMDSGDRNHDVESPFEEAVLHYVRELGYEVLPQVGVAGYRIDLGVRHPDQQGAFLLGIECDGAMYHSSRAARDRDRIRHDVLVGLGWRLHHIWGTAWFRHPDREKQRLKETLARLQELPVTGMLPTSLDQSDDDSAVKTTMASPVVDVRSQRPEWAAEYEVAKPDEIGPWVDLGDTSGRWAIRKFVEQVAEVEAPIHMSVLGQRLREASHIGRVGARIRSNLIAACKSNDYSFDGEILRLPNEKISIRYPNAEFTRSPDEVPIEELVSAVEHAVEDAVSIDRDELTRYVAGVFGWLRVSAETRARLELAIDGAVDSGNVKESGRGLRMS
ncbi:DNA helicase related protein [Agrococcus casei LMG 22410]|uniref:DNA helicase related protein n=1 Tax=Agrococcus casei LMG 22410 TaxID=1255656 RepID=A0A1R4GBG5_9MICO|nr:DNA helicase related protein [Agrococcus casei LMG 22410]